MAVCKNSGCSTNRNEQRRTAGKEAQAERLYTGVRLEEALHPNRNVVVFSQADDQKKETLETDPLPHHPDYGQGEGRRMHGLPLRTVGIAVAVVLWVNAIALQAAGALLAAGLSSAPVRLHATRTWTTEPPAERRTL